MQEQINALVDFLNERHLERCVEQNLGDPNEKFVAESGPKWTKIWKRRPGEKHGSAYAFIAMENFQNKTLGVVLQGDIHKPASYQAPAKHARGNVLAADGGKDCCGIYSVDYLR